MSERMVIDYKDDRAFAVEVVVAGTREIIDFKKAMMINEKNLAKECAEQPGLFAWYSAILADQESKQATAKQDLERFEAEVALNVRQGKTKILAQDGKDIKITEDALRNFVLSDKRYRTLQDEVHYYESVCKKFRLLVSASVQRKDMLIQLALLSRQEMKNFGGPMG